VSTLTHLLTVFDRSTMTQRTGDGCFQQPYAEHASYDETGIPLKLEVDHVEGK
jgi:hypothetical protein